jgi:hypothetical protein
VQTKRSPYTDGQEGFSEAELVMANYVQQQSVGDIIRNTFAIYGKGFVVIFLSYFLPLLPFGICANEAAAAQAMGLYWLIVLCSLPVSLAATSAITISVSDICLGNAPSLARAYKKVFGVMWKLLATNILQVVIIFIGIMLLVVPGIIAMVWLIFTPSVVILEGLGGFTALKRSKDLARGYNWRNFGVFLLMLTILFVIGFVLGAIFGLLLPSAPHAFRIFQAAVNLVSGTITLTMIVLLYYDLRARKEAYDPAALAEDLRR